MLYKLINLKEKKFEELKGESHFIVGVLYITPYIIMKSQTGTGFVVTICFGGITLLVDLRSIYHFSQNQQKNV